MQKSSWPQLSRSYHHLKPVNPLIHSVFINPFKCIKQWASSVIFQSLMSKLQKCKCLWVSSKHVNGFFQLNSNQSKLWTSVLTMTSVFFPQMWACWMLWMSVNSSSVFIERYLWDFHYFLWYAWMCVCTCVCMYVCTSV